MLCNLSKKDLREILDHIEDSGHGCDQELIDRLEGYLKACGPVRPEERPELTLANLRNRWLAIDNDPVPPDTLREFLQRSHDILFEWFDRWNKLYDLVNPSYFKTPEDRKLFVDQNEMKILAVWHAIRSLREYWRAAGVWKGNPYDPKDRTPISSEDLTAESVARAAPKPRRSSRR